MKIIGAATVTAMLFLGACTGSQVTSAVTKTASVTSAISAACADALPLANLAIAIPTVGPFIAAGVQVGCATDAGIAKLASDPTSAAWLGQQAQMLKDALDNGAATLKSGS